MSMSTTSRNILSPWSQPQIQPLSLGAGDLSTALRERLRDLYTPPPSAAALQPSVVIKPLVTDKSLRLFNVAAALKIAVSQVSMHLPSDWRHRLFEKIDALHEPDDWEESDHLADLDSFNTFLRTVLQQGAMERMSLGIDSNGHILAGWKRGNDSLSLSFLANDEIRWSVVLHDNGALESAAGRTNLARLPEVLRPYSPEVWFRNANKVSTS